MRASGAAAVSAVLATVLAGGGCYKPNIKSGGLACGAGNACPDGFRCDVTLATPLCVNGGLGGAAGTGAGGKAGAGGSATGGQTGSGGQTGAGGTGGTGGVMCLPAITGCTSSYVDGGACDPVCNVGCPSCDEKCSVNMAGNMTCNPSPPGRPTVGFMQPCDVVQPTGDVATQTDDCAPGQVCLQQTTCGTLCYQFCRTNADCASQNCGRDIANGLKVCDVTPTPCDPTLMTPCSASTIQSRCFISGQTGLTLCDCPNYKQLGTIGDGCTHSRDCFPGLVCYNNTGAIGGSRCFRACRLPTDGGAPDAGSSTCAGGAANCKPMLLPMNGTFSAVWGYCEE